jgi:hypothetical protein
MYRAVIAALCLGLISCATNQKPYQKLDYDKMGLETKDRGGIGNPAVGSPDSERLGHEKIESLQAEATKARAEGAKAVEGLTPASQPSSQPAKP